MDEYHDELMNLSSSDISDSDETSLSRKSTQSNYSIDGMDRLTSDKIRNVISSINKAKESLKRKKQRYDKKKQQLESKSLELEDRERKLKEREDQLNGKGNYSPILSDNSSLQENQYHSSSVAKRLEEENLRLRKEINDLHLQLELQSRSSTRDFSIEKEDYRRRAMELTRREQEILKKEQEIDEYHEEAARMKLEAEEKQREADRMYYAKQKYIDELEAARKQVDSHEVEINEMERVKSEAIEKRREQVRLLEEELAKHCEEVEKREKEVEKREKELYEHQEELERQFAERECKLSDHQEEIEAALVNLKETQELYSKMDSFVKEKRQTLLEKESLLQKQQQQLENKQKHVDQSESEYIHEHTLRLDLETQVKQYQEKLEGYEKRITDLQSILAESKNENMKLSQEYLRYKDLGDTADRRIGLFSKTNEELQQKIDSQNIFILQLQKRIAELQESNYFIANDHSRATLALNEVNDQVSRLLAAVNGRSPQKPLPAVGQQSGLSTASFVQQQPLPEVNQNLHQQDSVNEENESKKSDEPEKPVKRVLFPPKPTAEENEIALDPSFSVHENDLQSRSSLDL